MKYLIFLLLTVASFAQTNTGELDRDGRIIYEKIFEDASIDVEEIKVIDEDMYRIYDHRGLFRIGTQKGFNTFPYTMFVKYKSELSLLFVNVNYKFEGNRIIITAKNTIDDIVFPLGIQYYIVVRYTKK